MVLETPTNIHIFEFKVNETANLALEQIEQKGYANPYLAANREIIIVGINFKNRELNEWVSKNLNAKS